MSGVAEIEGPVVQEEKSSTLVGVGGLGLVILGAVAVWELGKWGFRKIADGRSQEIKTPKRTKKSKENEE